MLSNKKEETIDIWATWGFHGSYIDWTNSRSVLQILLFEITKLQKWWTDKLVARSWSQEVRKGVAVAVNGQQGAFLGQSYTASCGGHMNLHVMKLYRTKYTYTKSFEQLNTYTLIV